MNISFGDLNVTLVANPFDLRSGYPKLSAFVRDQLGIDLTKGEDAVVFVSKSRKTVKVVMSDVYGVTLVNRKLHAGRFPKIKMSPEGDAKIALTVAELEKFLNGWEIQVERSNFFQG